MDSEINICLNVLRDSINIDPNQFNRAKTDSMYDGFRTQIDALLNEMYHEVKTNAKYQFSKLNSESDLNNISRLSNNEYVSKDIAIKFDDVLNNIKIIDNMVMLNSDCGYIDANEKIHEMNKILHVIRKIFKNDKESIGHRLSAYESRNAENIIELENISDKIRDLNAKKPGLLKKILIVYGSSLTFIIPIVGLIVCSYSIKYLFRVSIIESIVFLVILYIIFLIIGIMLILLLSEGVANAIFLVFIIIFIIIVPFIPYNSNKSELNDLKNRGEDIEKQIKSTSVQLEEMKKIWLQL